MKTMVYECEIVKDSISRQWPGNRITTFKITFPRSVLVDFNTHRALSRSSASSRAVPTVKYMNYILQQVEERPFFPHFGKNRKGMQADEDGLTEKERALCNEYAMEMRDTSLRCVKKMLEVSPHKQDVNRYLEPFMDHTVITTATEWINFFNQRSDGQADPKIGRISDMMLEAYWTNEPQVLDAWEWHLPLVSAKEMMDYSSVEAISLSVARCARVSYLRQDEKFTREQDFALASKLLLDGHFAPFEHAAQCQAVPDWSGNFYGWTQFRKTLQGENRTMINPAILERLGLEDTPKSRAIMERDEVLMDSISEIAEERVKGTESAEQFR